MEDLLYYYKAVVNRVVDGDTVVVLIDMGFYTWRVETVRLARIDAPEPHTETRQEGVAASNFLRDLVEGKAVLVRTFQNERDGFKRYIAEIWIGDLNVNDHLVNEGHAVYREY